MPEPVPPALEIADLKFRYAAGNGAWVVDVRRLTVGRGEQVLLTGGSGRGKSTLMYLIAGLLDPASGVVRVGGEGVHARQGAARDLLRGRSIGMVFQTFNLLKGFSALENVMAALMFSPLPKGEHRARAAGLLASLGIERPRAEVDELSVGQQQRVAVARAVACRPMLVLADEPTASLDPENAAGALELIQATCREAGAALLCVTHDPSARGRFGRHATLEELSRG